MQMLKLPVPFASCLRTLTNTACVRERIPFNSKELIALKKSRCLDYERALEKCRKSKLAKNYGKKTFADNVPQAKCNWSNADDYRRAYEAIKVRSEKLTKLVENTTTSILDDAAAKISKIHQDENSLTRRILRSVEPKSVELLNLDPACAMKKKLDVLVLNDRTQRELKSLRDTRELGLESIECDLEQLKIELKSRVNLALDLIWSCRKSKSPQSLIECVELNSREAAKILDDVKDDFETRAKSIKMTNEETIKGDIKRVREVTEIFEENMADLISGMTYCIRIRKSG